jgi:hypothetical protein
MTAKRQTLRRSLAIKDMLCLYVAGETSDFRFALSNLRRFCVDYATSSHRTLRIPRLLSRSDSISAG